MHYASVAQLSGNLERLVYVQVSLVAERPVRVLLVFSSQLDSHQF